jgi:hypothetical protein
MKGFRTDDLNVRAAAVLARDVARWRTRTSPSLVWLTNKTVIIHVVFCKCNCAWWPFLNFLRFAYETRL